MLFGTDQIEGLMQGFEQQPLLLVEEVGSDHQVELEGGSRPVAVGKTLAGMPQPQGAPPEVMPGGMRLVEVPVGMHLVEVPGGMHLVVVPVVGRLPVRNLVVFQTSR